MSGRLLTRFGLASAAALGLLIAIAMTLRGRGPTQKQAPVDGFPGDLAGAAVQAPPAPAEPLGARTSPTATPPVSSPRPAESAPFADENAYLGTLDELHGTDKRRALALIDQGEKWYPNSGVRTEARRALGISLLVDLGEMNEARERVRRFIVEHPTSRYRPLVQGLTGIHPRPGGPNASPQ